MFTFGGGGWALLQPLLSRSFHLEKTSSLAPPPPRAHPSPTCAHKRAKSCFWGSASHSTCVILLPCIVQAQRFVEPSLYVDFQFVLGEKKGGKDFLNPPVDPPPQAHPPEREKDSNPPVGETPKFKKQFRRWAHF